MSSIGGIGQQYYQPYTPPTFSQFDTDSSGGISLDEFEAAGPKSSSSSDATQSAAQQKRAEALFKKIDSDGDGSISNDELTAFQSKLADQRQSQAFSTQLLASNQQPASDADVFAATDKNGDGSVTLDEFSQSSAAKDLSTDQVQQIFSTIDKNGDGSISATESSQFFDQLRSDVPGAGGAGGPPPGGPPPGGGVHGGGGHHHGSSGAGSSDDSSSGDSLLATLENIIGNNATSGASTDTASTDSSSDDSSDSGTSSPLDLLTAAVNAYSTGANSTNLWSSLSSMLQEAA